MNSVIKKLLKLLEKKKIIANKYTKERLRRYRQMYHFS